MLRECVPREKQDVARLGSGLRVHRAAVAQQGPQGGGDSGPHGFVPSEFAGSLASPFTVEPSDKLACSRL